MGWRQDRAWRGEDEVEYDVRKDRVGGGVGHAPDHHHGVLRLLLLLTYLALCTKNLVVAAGEASKQERCRKEDKGKRRKEEREMLLTCLFALAWFQPLILPSSTPATTKPHPCHYTVN